MSGASLSSGKTAADENFPVASRLIAPRHRELVMRFYAVARLADDIADHPHAPAADKLARLNAIEATLTGAGDAVPEAVRLREALAGRGLSPRHMLDLLRAFRRDVTQSRYANWDDLMDYCRWSAAPVGRFMLDVHGEDEALWPMSDALCAALQVVNHLQDCARDFRDLDRVYLPLDALAAEGASVADLGAPHASPELRRAVAGLARRTQGLLSQSRDFAPAVRDGRLAVDVAVIQALAESLAARLLRRDPLSERVHHGKAEALAIAAGAGAVSILSGVLGRRPRGPAAHPLAQA
ncbi:MAG: squalene synthase HpnC [Caulobacteraceae bacterium]|nr:squalene synthase HpnC [Caulobacteraceae bacterium]